MTRDFKGVWIPKEIWLNDSLTLQEKVFLAEIDSLDNEDGCFATNEHFSQFFKISRVRVSEVIASLVRKGLITSEIHHEPGRGNIRTLRTLLKVSLIGSQRKVEEGIKGKFKRGIKESLTAVIGINNPINNTSNNYDEAAAEIPSRFKAEKENPIPPVAPAPLSAPPAGYRPLNIEAEIQRLESDDLVKESFQRRVKLPLDAFGVYVKDFSLHVQTLQKTYSNVTEFRSHFFNYCDTHKRKQADTPKPPTPGLPRDMVNLNAL